MSHIDALWADMYLSHMNNQQKIPFWTAVLMSINIIIGAGLYAGVQSVSSIAGEAGFLSWILAAMLVFPIVWSVSKAPSLFPGEGGFYNYIKKGLSENTGFFAHWHYMLGYMIGTTAAMVILLQQNIESRLNISIFSDYPWTSNALFILLFSALNLLPVSIVSRAQAGITILKLSPLLIVIPTGLFYWKGGFTIGMDNLTKLPSTIPVVIFAYLGFETCCSLSHILKDGPKSVGKVTITAFGITAVLYSVFHMTLLQVMNIEQLGSLGAMAFPTFISSFENWLPLLAFIMTSSILLSFANTLFGISLANIENFMGIFSERTHKAMAALVQAIMVWLMLCINNNPNHLMSFAIVGVGTAYLLTSVSVLKISLGKKDMLTSFIASLGSLACLVLFYVCWIGLGDSTLDKLQVLTPFIGASLLGLTLHRMNMFSVERN